MEYAISRVLSDVSVQNDLPDQYSGSCATTRSAFLLVIHRMALRLLWKAGVPLQSAVIDHDPGGYGYFRLCENCGSQIVDTRMTRFCCNACSELFRERMFRAEREAKGTRPVHSWKSIRLEILGRDNYTCMKCRGSYPSSRLEIHHIIPVSEGGNSLPGNLITECVECHRKERTRVERAKRHHVSLGVFLEIPVS
jgi:5-methylcytosine-specific restriction endonuclease McrA